MSRAEFETMLSRPGLHAFCLKEDREHVAFGVLDGADVILWKDGRCLLRTPINTNVSTDLLIVFYDEKFMGASRMGCGVVMFWNAGVESPASAPRLQAALGLQG